MILKAGTYRFNDVLEHGGYIPSDNADYLSAFMNIDNYVNFQSELNGEITEIGLFAITDNINGNNVFYLTFAVSGAYQGYAYRDGYDNTPATYTNEWLQIGENSYFNDLDFTLTVDTEVSDTFATWYIPNTNYNEVNAKPLAEITYNGETIAQLKAGETATLSCGGMKMASDLVIKINS